jgi:hypothetical protein
MLLDRDAQIQELKMLVNQGQDQSDFLGTIQDLEDKVQALEAELRAREEADDDEEPVFVKSESRKVQRSAAPPPARNVQSVDATSSEHYIRRHGFELSSV